MRKFIYCLIIIIFSLSIFGCDASPTTYRVNRETGVYPSLDSVDFQNTVSAGTRVKPADGAENILCKFSEIETGIKLCYVEFVNTGKTGWILKNAIDF